MDHDFPGRSRSGKKSPPSIQCLAHPSSMNMPHRVRPQQWSTTQPTPSHRHPRPFTRVLHDDATPEEEEPAGGLNSVPYPTPTCPLIG